MAQYIIVVSPIYYHLVMNWELMNWMTDMWTVTLSRHIYSKSTA